jgi:hypothetical protein
MKEEKIPEFPGFLKILGPGIIWLALAQGSGELIWWPYLAAKYGGALLFLLIPSALVQLPLTYYIGRYSLLTGESIWRGFLRANKYFSIFLWVMMNFSFLWFGSFVVAGGTALSELIPLGMSRKAESILWGYLLILGMYIVLMKSKKVYDVIEKIMMFVAIGTFVGLVISCSYRTVLEKIPDFFVSFFKPNLKVVGEEDYEKVITAITFMGLGGFWSLFYSYWILGKGMGMAKLTQNKFISGFIPSKDTPKNKISVWKKALLLDSSVGVVGNLITTIMTTLLAFAILNPKGLFPTEYKIAVVQAEFFAEWGGELGRRIFLFASALFLVDTWISTADAVARTNIDIIKFVNEKIIKDENKAYKILITAITIITCITLPIAPPGELIVFTAVIGFFGMGAICVMVVLTQSYFLPKLSEILKESKIEKISIFITTTIYISLVIIYIVLKLKI